MIRKRTTQPGTAWRAVASGLAQFLVPPLVLIALLCLGEWARHRIAHLDRYCMPFHQIDCTEPPGLSKATFLDEVQYLAGLPDQLALLEDGLPERLSRAFARHPWVEHVEQVEIRPAQQVRVRLVFRVPVLAVMESSGLRAVDRHGILLPTTADTDGLPVYASPAAPPAGPSGTPWGDRGVEAAARSASQKRAGPP